MRSQWRIQGINVERGEGQNIFGISNARAKGTRNTGGLERYFTYFRTRLEEKLQPQKAIFKSPYVGRSKEYIKRCTVYAKLPIQQQNSTMSSFL